ncbi:MAG: LamB/YcsF family protein [Anaerolineales bacterium]|nr:LamB/YcsF family protein [Anaerolineales bacterium]
MPSKALMKIDLNCDLGESFGNDAAIMPYITSANIACGFHAGDASVMQATVRLAKQYGVNIGAHPGWPDFQNFGRNEMNLSVDKTEVLVLYQIGALAGIAKAEGMELVHVKPHGALYNQAAQDKVLAQAIVRAVKAFNRKLILVGLAGSSLVEAGLESGLQVANEGFPDRGYNSDGTLMSRSIKDALIESPDEVAENAIKLIKEGIIFGAKRVSVNTLCLHGDNINTAENAQMLREVLLKNGVEIKGLK